VDQVWGEGHDGPTQSKREYLAWRAKPQRAAGICYGGVGQLLGRDRPLQALWSERHRRDRMESPITASCRCRSVNMHVPRLPKRSERSPLTEHCTAPRQVLMWTAMPSKLLTMARNTTSRATGENMSEDIDKLLET